MYMLNSMDNDPQEIAKAIKNGEYFQQARAWYGATYIAQISERSYFLIIAVLAAVAGLCSLISLSSLMPLVERPAAIIPARDSSENYVPYLVRLREKGTQASEAMERFFVIQYVNSREGYTAAEFQRNAAFVRAQSNASVYSDYYAQNAYSNPQGFPKRFGKEGTQLVAISYLDIDTDAEATPTPAPAEGSTAAVPTNRVAMLRFETMSEIGEQIQKSKWTATMKYTYTSLGMTTEKNTTGDEVTKITDPKFQVISYVVKPDDAR